MYPRLPAMACLAVLSIVSGCETAPHPPAATSAPQSAFTATIAASSAVYLSHMTVVDGRRRYKITEVWRHDPALGPTPVPGDEWHPQFEPAEPVRDRGEWDSLIYIRPSSMGALTSISTVRDGRLVPSGIALAELKSLVAQTEAPPPPPASNIRQFSLKDCIAQADEVLLARRENGLDGPQFVVADVWRTSRMSGGAEIGSPVRGTASVAMAGRAQELVVFRMGDVDELGVLRRSGYFIRAVINGRVDGMPLGELHRQVMLATH